MSKIEDDEIGKIIGGRSHLLTRLIRAAREGHLCVEGGEVDCEVEELNGDEEWFDKRVGKWGNLFYLQRNWVLENRVVKEIKRLLGVAPLTLIDKKCNLEGMNEKQRLAVEVGSREVVTCLTGGPGTGKTFTIEKIVEQFRGKVCVCALTGKLCAILREKLDVEVKTIHQMLGVRGTRDLLFGESLLGYDMVIVDECSMIEVGMWARLLKGIGERTQLILVGDQDQLPPVEAGRVFGELCRFMKRSGRGYVHLDQCMRSDRKDILEMAKRVKEGEEIKYAPLKEGVEGWWNRGYQLLSCVRGGEYGVERMNHLLEQSEGNAQPIIMTQTSYRMGISNGEMGILQDGQVSIGNRQFKEELVPEYEKGYCLSVHKSQGSEFKRVVLLVPKGSERFGREVLYTGITRAKDEIVVLSEEGVIEKCVKHSSPSMSGLRKKLQSHTPLLLDHSY